MRRRFLGACVAAVALAAGGCATTPSAPLRDTPLVDHHQHVFSPATAQMLGDGFQPLDAAQLVALLDAAGIQRAVVLSAAYLHAGASRSFPDELARVQAENDWTGAQAALFPTRLRAFCSVNPLKDWAVAEIERCAREANLRGGLKLHLGNADLQLEDPEHASRLRAVFAAANAQRMAIVVHLRASVSRKRLYGLHQARVFLEDVLPAAPDVVVQVAHLGGTGPGWDDPQARTVIGILAEAVQRKHPSARNLYFDVASLANPKNSPVANADLVRMIRQVGVARVLYGSDSAVGGNLAPREAWAAFKALPLTPAEVAAIAGNVAPYLAAP